MRDIYNMSIEELKTLISENMQRPKDSYIIKNRGLITASKLKLFEKSPEAYFIKYILEEELPGDEEEDTTALKLGTAVDDYISYGEIEFNNKYDCRTRTLLKPDLVAMCEEQDLDPTGTVKVLEERLFGGKIKITPAESKKLYGMLNEWKRQPLFDYNGKYETQKKIRAKYKNLTLGATLDRLWIERGFLRDMKTTNNLEKFIYQVQEYSYDLSMGFYNLICKLSFEKDFIVLLDACQSTAPYPSCSFAIPKETIVNVGKNRIFPNLEKLSVLTEKWEKTGDPKVWLSEGRPIEELYSLDTYCKMETTLQKEYKYLQ